MAVEQIRETDTLNQGRIKINNILDASNAASEKVDSYKSQLNTGIDEAKKIASDKGDEAVRIATEAGNQANVTANEAKSIAQNANTKSDQAVSTANQNKQEFDQLRNDFDDLVAEAGDSNPEIVQARTDTEGIKQTTLANRLTADFSSRMSKADGIELISGQTVVSKMMDYQGKTAGNTSTNPHIYYSDFTANTLKKPQASWSEVSQTDYNKLASRDDSGISVGSTANGIIPQQLSMLNSVETAKRLSPQLFNGLSDVESVKFIKDNFVGFTLTVRAKVTSPNNKNLKVAIYMPATDSWNTLIQQDASDFTDFTIQVNDNQYIDDAGKTYIIYYSDAANGVTASNVTIDYSGTQLKLTLNAQNILEKSGFVKQEDVASIEEFNSLKSDFTAHESNKDNPHRVTAAQLGAVSKSELLDFTYPIGSVYQSTVSTNPTILFGGSWEALKGRVLVGVDESDSDFNASGKTGGVKTQELRAAIGVINGVTSSLGYAPADPIPNVKYTFANAGGGASASNINHSTQVKTAAGGNMSTLQPYQTVYMWKRTA